ncbi:MULTISPECIES: hypothetical protein [Bacillaceae]|uniref:hypothetical protein n=1 Tax=Bacillaceae TaxID=186817 RepID=UPI0006F8B62D|nr:hypothetical protein [Bacillus sp. FJAT-25509]KQL34480.1 hypothetical protein AN960_18855 [Bacillus sp. FJAT-25509]
MKKILLTSFMLLFMIPSTTYGESLVNAKCPPTENLQKPNIKDKDELISALNDIIPKIYGTDLNHKEWRIEKIQPAASLTGFEKHYFGIAVTFCGKEVANHSWFVRLIFPRMLPAVSAATGELYIVKDRNDNWIPWFQYH